MATRKSNRIKLLANLWLISIILFVFRSIFEPLIYPAALSIVLLVVFSGICLLKNWKRNIISIFFNIVKENIILIIFIVVAIISSTGVIIHPLKELINLMIVLVLLFTFLIVNDKLYIDEFIKYWIISALFIGVIALLSWLNYTLSMDLWFLKYVETDKSVKAFTSLTSDNNFYALIFLIAIIFQLYKVYKTKTKINSFFVQLILWVFIINVLFSGSRRALVFFGVFFFWSLFVSVKHYKAVKNSLFYKNIIVLISTLVFSLVFIILLVPFRSEIVKDSTLKYSISYNTYRLFTMFSKDISFETINQKLWSSPEAFVDISNEIPINDEKSNQVGLYYDSLINVGDQNCITDNNLIINGTFKCNNKYWSTLLSTKDSVKHSIIPTIYGKAIRVSRFKGSGFWPLAYKGRPIYYIKGVEYTFKFKYRVIKGEGAPFNIGWWIKDGGSNVYNLKKYITPIGSSWNECSCSYTFKEDHFGWFPTFMNSQQNNTIVDFADILLEANDTSKKYLPKYIIYDPSKVNLLYNSYLSDGVRYWTKYISGGTNLSIVNTRFGKAIEVEKNDKARSFWPLIYEGRKLFLHNSKLYTFRFLFRVIKGDLSSFSVGIAIKDNDHYLYSLPRKLYELEEGWILCTASFTLIEDHFITKPLFISNQLPNTVVQYANIELLCDSSLLDSSYIDQNLDKYRIYERQNMEELSKNDTIDKLLAPRLDRWKYAVEIYKSYSITEKIFGKGFDYMAQFNKKFYNPDMTLEDIREKQMYDYPHSPILSSFLFSGIIGGMFYLYFTALTFWYYFKNRKELQVFFIMWLIGYSFIIVSDNTHFSAPIFVILSLVPYVWERLPGMKNRITNPTEETQI